MRACAIPAWIADHRCDRHARRLRLDPLRRLRHLYRQIRCHGCRIPAVPPADTGPRARTSADDGLAWTTCCTHRLTQESGQQQKWVDLAVQCTPMPVFLAELDHFPASNLPVRAAD